MYHCKMIKRKPIKRKPLSKLKKKLPLKKKKPLKKPKPIQALVKKVLKNQGLSDMDALLINYRVKHNLQQ